MIGKDNKVFKNVLKLKQKKFREQEDKFIIEGLRFVEEAVNNGVVDTIFYTLKQEEEVINSLFKAPVNKYEVSENMMKNLCDTENPQGIAAVINKNKWNIDDIKNDFVVVSDGIQDPGNLGTIIRTSDASGAGAVIIIKGTVDVYNSKTLRSTMGSIFHIPIIYFDSFEDFIDEFKNRQYNIYASSLSSSEYIYDCNFKSKTAIIIGNEANGMPQEHIELCTHTTKIPMIGMAESLNAASAASIMIYEVLRQRLTN